MKILIAYDGSQCADDALDKGYVWHNDYWNSQGDIRHATSV